MTLGTHDAVEPQGAVESGRARDAVNTRRLLLEAARRRFAHDGYGATTSRDIAADAGVNVALINRYFVSKEGLFEACLARTVQELDDEGAQIARCASYQVAPICGFRYRVCTSRGSLEDIDIAPGTSVGEQFLICRKWCSAFEATGIEAQSDEIAVDRQSRDGGYSNVPDHLRIRSHGSERDCGI